MPPNTTPKLKRPAYHVWLDPRADITAASPELDESELVYHHVVVNNGDQLRAELEANKLRIVARDNPMHLTNLWLWAAMARTGMHDSKFPTFKLRLIAYDPDQEREHPHTEPEDPELGVQLDELDAHPTAASSS